MHPILRCLCDCKRVGMLRIMTWAVANLCGKKPSPDFASVFPAIPVLRAILCAPDDEILSEACRALWYLTDGTNNRIEAVLREDSIVPRLVELLDYDCPSVQTFSLNTIASIVTGNGAHTQAVLDCPMALPLLKKSLHDPDPEKRKKGCWAISNIAAGSREQIQMVIDAGVIPLVVAMIISNNEEVEEIKKEAVYVLSNIFSCGSDDQIMYLVKQDAISGFLSSLDNNDSEEVVACLACCLEGLERVLKIGQDSNRFGEENPFVAKVEENDDFYKLEDLQIHKNTKICEKAQAIMEKYFEKVKFKGIK